MHGPKNVKIFIWRLQDVSDLPLPFAYERVKTHKKIIYGLAFHSFTTVMALPIADSFLREITAGSFSL